MAAPILPISPSAIPQAVRPANAPASGGGFQDLFSSAVQKVEAVNQNASVTVEKFLSGEGGELHTAVLATTRADLAFEMFMQARNKVVNAYQEIMKMQM